MMRKTEVQELLRQGKTHRCRKGRFGGVCVKIVAIADLRTRFGHFQIVAFSNNQDGKEHAAIVKGNVCGKENVPTRLHSECLTGDALGSMRCDCRDQLTTALEKIGKLPAGIILYLRQEGRGIGFINKIRAYALQDSGYDTVEADLLLGFSGDERKYDIAAHMLASLNVKSIKLMTNNPRKIEELKQHGVRVVSRMPHIIAANKYNRAYLETKRLKAGHLLLDLSEKKLEQDDTIIVE